MPNRFQVVATLANDALDQKGFHFTATHSGRYPYEIWDAAENVADALYYRVVDLVDWNRVIIEATSLHLQKIHPDLLDNNLCGTCIREALLATDRSFHWEKNGGAYIPEPTVKDWANGVAEAVGMRT